MPLVCNGIFGTPLLCGKPDVGPTKPSIAASRYSAVLRQQVGLRPIGNNVEFCAARLSIVSFARPPDRLLASVTAALIGRNCCWRLQPSGLCRAATVVAEVFLLQTRTWVQAYMLCCCCIYYNPSQQLRTVFYIADA